MNHNISTYRSLLQLVKLDKSDHALKVIGEFFLSALRDWPSDEHLNIPESVAVFKLNFGDPLTVENTTRYNGAGPYSSWKGEAGIALSRMIEHATQHFNVSDFDEIVGMLLAHYAEKEL